MYVSEENTSFGFMTNVSLSNENTNRGIASNLLKKCIEYSNEISLNCICLL